MPATHKHETVHEPEAEYQVIRLLSRKNHP